MLKLYRLCVLSPGADRQGNRRLHFGKPKKEAIQQGALNTTALNYLTMLEVKCLITVPLYDTDALVKTMTANFNQDNITLKTSKEADKPASGGEEGRIQ